MNNPLLVDQDGLSKPVVKRAQLVEHRICEYVTEASTIGLRPGQWPDELPVEDIGNNMPLLRGKISSTIEDVEFVLYHQQFGNVSVKVFND